MSERIESGPRTSGLSNVKLWGRGTEGERTVHSASLFLHSLVVVLSKLSSILLLDLLMSDGNM